MHRTLDITCDHRELIAAASAETRAGESVALTWEQITAIEPRLREVNRLATESTQATSFDSLLKLLAPLVGANAEKPQMRVPAAYRTAYDHVLETHQQAVSKAIRAARQQPRSPQDVARLLVSRREAATIGRDACLLLCFIATRPQPAMLTERELVAALACESVDELSAIIERAVAAGWLRVVWRSIRTAGEFTISVPREERGGE